MNFEIWILIKKFEFVQLIPLTIWNTVNAVNTTKDRNGCTINDFTTANELFWALRAVYTEIDY